MASELEMQEAEDTIDRHRVRIAELAAENERLREALVRISNRPSLMAWGEEYELQDAISDMVHYADAALAIIRASKETEE